MWLPKTEEELKYDERKREKKAKISGLFLFIFFPLIMSFKNKFLGTRKGILFDSTLTWSQIFDDLPNLFLISIIGGILVYIGFRKYNEVSTHVCLKCGKLKQFKKHDKCDCGGELRLLNEMKWIENNEQNQKHE